MLLLPTQGTIRMPLLDKNTLFQFGLCPSPFKAHNTDTIMKLHPSTQAQISFHDNQFLANIWANVYYILSAIMIFENDPLYLLLVTTIFQQYVHQFNRFNATCMNSAGIFYSLL